MQRQKQPAMQIGLSWYRREDWDRLRTIFPDRAAQHDSYNDWHADVLRNEKRLKREGYIIKRIIITPDELVTWCALRGLPPNGAARAQFVSEKTHAASSASPKP